MPRKKGAVFDDTLRALAFNTKRARAHNQCQKLTASLANLLRRKSKACTQANIAYVEPGEIVFGPLTKAQTLRRTKKGRRGRAKGFKLSEETRLRMKTSRANMSAQRKAEIAAKAKATRLKNNAGALTKKQRRSKVKKAFGKMKRAFTSMAKKYKLMEVD